MIETPKAMVLLNPRCRSGGQVEFVVRILESRLSLELWDQGSTVAVE